MCMSWGTRRRNLIISIFLIVIFTIIAFASYSIIYEEPTCFDGKENGLEKGVDCGGSCILICDGDALDPFVKWSRFFQVVPGLYNAVAYVENQNTNAKTDYLEYLFTMYDEDNVIIAERRGSIRLNPKSIVPIVETGFNTGAIIPDRITFEIVNDLVWNTEEPNELVLQVIDDVLIQSETNPRVTANIRNVGFDDIEDIEVVAIIYNSEGNAIASSSTFIERLNANNLTNIVFTWPQGFEGTAARVEVIPLYEYN